MARSARVQFPGAVYHISPRSNHQENIYFSDHELLWGHVPPGCCPNTPIVCDLA